ncbi:hypothetical protein E2C01_009732 [Portunus trituberculatus]|uniref:Uncharacterized protein n=1 Tax=Portunus trituberculatus TaxID=210409 RepID=A0A5B7D6K0_PORTR|nr:hypothetical protein [Portunus trituberculatus]
MNQLGGGQDPHGVSIKENAYEEKLKAHLFPAEVSALLLSQMSEGGASRGEVPGVDLVQPRQGAVVLQEPGQLTSLLAGSLAQQLPSLPCLKGLDKTVSVLAILFEQVLVCVVAQGQGGQGAQVGLVVGQDEVSKVD